MDGVATAHGRLVRDASIQFGFPPPDPVHATAPIPPPHVHLGDGTVLFWVVIAVVLAATVAVGLGLWSRRGPGAAYGSTPSQEPPPAALPAPVAVPRAALDEADVLAASGRYGDAVHILLLRGVEAIGRRFPGILAPSHTSRDIAGLRILPDPTRRAFAGLAERTERAVFARRALAEEDWDACRALYAGLLPSPPGSRAARS